jgi:NAD(P)H-hydrate epimerase
MTAPLGETETGSISLRALGTIHEAADNKSVLAIGPGISRFEEASQVVRLVVNSAKIPMVLDADGLNAFEHYKDELKGHGRTLVLTPHPGEMSRLTGLTTAAIQGDRINVARSFAQEHGVILVLKGDRTIVVGTDGQAWVNPTGNPGMATGGTGDILTGMIAGLLAQHPDQALVAVLAAVYLHGLAGDIACYGTHSAAFGEQCLVATDLISAFPAAFRRVRAEAKDKWVRIGLTRPTFPKARGRDRE